MSLFVFSTLILSVIFFIVFNAWWVTGASFNTHLSALMIAATTALTSLLLIAIYPIFRKHYTRHPKPSMDHTVTWANDVSSNLSTPAAVIDGYIVKFANKAFLMEIGMLSMQEQVVGMPLTNIIHPGDHQLLASLFAKTTATQDKKNHLRIRLLCLDGSILPTHVSISPIQEDSRSVVNLLQFSSSLSQKMEASSEFENAIHEQLINHIEQIVFYLKVNQEIIFLNHSWESMLGYKVQECLNKTLLTFVHPEDKPLAEARITSLIQGKRNKTVVEFRLIARNGDSHWVELRAKNTTAYKGERSSIIGTLTDISQMKLTESTKRSHRHLLNALINNTPGMIYRCKNDKNWSFEFVSEGAVDITGYEPYEMIGNPNFSYAQIIHPEDRNIAWDHVQEKIRHQQKFQLLYRIYTRSGGVKWVLEQGKGVFSSAGELLALEGFITDVAQEDGSQAIQSLQKYFM